MILKGMEIGFGEDLKKINEQFLINLEAIKLHYHFKSNYFCKSIWNILIENKIIKKEIRLSYIILMSQYQH